MSFEERLDAIAMNLELFGHRMEDLGRRTEELGRSIEELRLRIEEGRQKSEQDAALARLELNDLRDSVRSIADTSVRLLIASEKALDKSERTEENLIQFRAHVQQDNARTERQMSDLREFVTSLAAASGRALVNSERTNDNLKRTDRQMSDIREFVTALAVTSERALNASERTENKLNDFRLQSESEQKSTKDRLDALLKIAETHDRRIALLERGAA